jgi:hypothetical protein
MAQPVEVILYIHGVSNDLRGRSHHPEYERLHQGVAKLKHSWPTKFKGVEWGWASSGSLPTSHELLTDAQRMLGGRVMPVLAQTWDFTLNPVRAAVNWFRPLMLYGFGDIFYYVSEDGKYAVREAVASQILSYVNSLKIGDRPLSLTLLGHSAGAVVAFDFLFALFRKHVANAEAVHHFLGGETTRVHQSFTALRNKCEQGKVRVRRLITFGAPITPLACRSDAVLSLLANETMLDPADYGLTDSPFDKLKGPRWINIWDRDDPIAWPVEPLMNDPDRVVKDVYVDVSDMTSQVHDAYWASTGVYRVIADGW